jgi:hypothetical protein
MTASMIQKLDSKMSNFVDSMFTQLQDLQAMVSTRPGDVFLGIAEACVLLFGRHFQYYGVAFLILG